MAASPTPATTPYAGLKVVELADDPGGEMTGLQFVNLGAEVIKIEPPEGAPSRHVGPFVDDQPDPDAASPSGTTTAASAASSSTSRATTAALRWITCSPPPTCSSSPSIPAGCATLGLDLAAIAAARPSLIVLSITAFGLTGPWADYQSSDLVALATSGLLITSGYDDHTIPPIRPGGNQAYHTAASFAHQAALLALLQRQQNGAGGLIDVSIQEAAGVTVELANPYWFYPRALVQRQTCRHAQPVPTQSAIFQCADGRWVYFALILADRSRGTRSCSGWTVTTSPSISTDPEFDDLAHRQAELRPHPGPRGVLLPAAGQLGRLPRGPGDAACRSAC